MIGVDGQFVFRFSVANKRDFIFESNFVSLTMVEECGNYLPTFVLAFTLQDDDIIGYLHEGNDIQISFGRDPQEMFDGKMAITRAVIKRLQESRYISLTGTYSALEYTNQSRFVITEAVSSLEAIKQRAKAYFPAFTALVPKTDDTMRWISPGWSDRVFVNEVWAHSHLPGSFSAIGISTDGRFIVKDIKAAVTQPATWRITRDIKDPKKDLIYNDDAEYELNSGFMNSWVGYGKNQRIYNLESGTSETIEATSDPVVAITKKVAKRATMESRFAASGVQNDNMHPNYWRANLNNLVGLGSFSSVTVTLSYSGRFYPMRVLDTVMFKDDDIQSLRSVSSEFNSGLYMISKIVRTVQGRQIRTTLVMCRESFNAVR